MLKSMRSILAAAMIAGLMAFGGAPTALADQPGPHPGFGAQNFLTNNTLVYTDQDGQPNHLYFGRFDNFDLYFPCQFESGAWTLSEDMVLSLTYDNATFKPRQFKLIKTKGGFNLAAPSSGAILTTAKLLQGNHLPLG
ncbi:MAG: hypothetical protein O3A84_06955 [Proteobacteria bacterium]|nr:hypothetical protein [Pseudomonadota bacterium]